MQADSDAALALTPSSMGPTADPRATFVYRVRLRLKAQGAPVQLMSAELGVAAGQTIWILGVQMPNQHVMTLHAPMVPGTDPTSDATCDDIATRLTNWVRQLLAPK